MKKIKLHYVLVIGLLTLIVSSCNKGDAIEASSSDLAKEEVSEITKHFISPEHERDYNDYISGKLTIDDTLTKYNLSHLPISHSDWNLLFRGEISTEEINALYSTSLSKNDDSSKPSEIILKNVIGKEAYNELEAQAKLNEAQANNDLDNRRKFIAINNMKGSMIITYGGNISRFYYVRVYYRKNYLDKNEEPFYIGYQNGDKVYHDIDSRLHPPSSGDNSGYRIKLSTWAYTSIFGPSYDGDIVKYINSYTFEAHDHNPNDGFTPAAIIKKYQIYAQHHFFWVIAGIVEIY